MIIKDDITNNRAITNIVSEVSESQPIITRYLWKLGLGSRSLQLLIDNGYGLSFSIELDGEIYLEFGSKRCTNCGQVIPRTSRQAICTLCQESLSYKYRRCIFEGPGIPFGIHCTKENSPCNTDWMIAKCWSKHYLYLGRFGSKIKVGTSNCRRKEGKYYRLIEQGLDEALVLNNFSSLHDVLKAEEFIASEFDFTTFLTFDNKIDLLRVHGVDSPTITLQEYIEPLKEFYPDIKYSIVDLTDVWQKLPRDILIRRCSFPHAIKGEIIASRGNVLIVKPPKSDSTENILEAYNLSHLRGYELDSYKEI